MISYEIIFDNGGNATLQTESYCHQYSDMQQLASDVRNLIACGDTSDWDGNETESRISDEDYQEHAQDGGYKCITDVANLGDHNETNWENVREFCNAIKCQSAPVMHHEGSFGLAQSETAAQWLGSDVVLGRELTEEECEAVSAYSGRLVENELAHDAIAIMLEDADGTTMHVYSESPFHA